MLSSPLLVTLCSEGAQIRQEGRFLDPIGAYNWSSPCKSQVGRDDMCRKPLGLPGVCRVFSLRNGFCAPPFPSQLSPYPAGLLLERMAALSCFG